jgi:hypothetical protein
MVRKPGSNETVGVKSASWISDGFVAPFYDEPPDEKGAEGDRDILADTENLQAGGHPGKFRDGVSQVGEEKGDHEIEGHPGAKPLADQVREAFPRNHAHAGAHFLDEDESQGNGNEGPEEG